jgi:hypothetical protein
MNQYSSFFVITGPAPKESGAKIKYNNIRSGSVGSVLNVVSAKEVRAMQKFVVANSQFGWYGSLYKKPAGRGLMFISTAPSSVSVQNRCFRFEQNKHR